MPERCWAALVQHWAGIWPASRVCFWVRIYRANEIHWTNAGPMLARRWRRVNISPALVQCIVLVGWYPSAICQGCLLAVTSTMSRTHRLWLFLTPRGLYPQAPKNSIHGPSVSPVLCHNPIVTGAALNQHLTNVWSLLGSALPSKSKHFFPRLNHYFKN